SRRTAGQGRDDRGGAGLRGHPLWPSRQELRHDDLRYGGVTSMRQSAQGKPLPEITDLTRPFWAAARDSKLVMQKCAGCGTMNFHPKPWCIECGDRRLEWTEVRQTGTVYSHTTA